MSNDETERNKIRRHLIKQYEYISHHYFNRYQYSLIMANEVEQKIKELENRRLFINKERMRISKEREKQQNTYHQQLIQLRILLNQRKLDYCILSP